MAEELTIGRFSRLSSLTVKALRYYDEIGLLVPARVDEATGYRYYSVSQLDVAELIATLRRVEMPLEAISAALRGDPDARDQLERHRNRLISQAQQTRDHIATVERLIDAASLLPNPPPTPEFTLKRYPAVPVLSVHRRVKFNGWYDLIVDSIHHVQAFGDSRGYSGLGPPYAVVPDPDDEGMVSVEIGLRTPRLLQGADDVEARVLAGGRAAATTFLGPYSGLRDLFPQLHNWMMERCLHPAGDPIEVYLTALDDRPPEVPPTTEILWPVR